MNIGGSKIDGIYPDETDFSQESIPNNRRVELLSGARYYTSATDDGEGILLLDGNYLNLIESGGGNMFFTQYASGGKLLASEFYDIAVTEKQRVVITALLASTTNQDNTQFSIESPVGTSYIANGTRLLLRINESVTLDSHLVVRSTGDSYGSVPALNFKMGESVRITSSFTTITFSYVIEEAY